ncbi:hypothetical protein HDU67_009844 [Dinochytrium kinnereticum]|nr:hypothetical protein HDU67_009844 [Dinochytrium kinnereticum]
MGSRVSSPSIPLRVGTVFVTSAPRPLGGKRSPGYIKMLKTRRLPVEELADWIVDVSCVAPKCGRGFRVVPPGECMEFSVAKANGVLGLRRLGKRDEMDNLVLRGLAVSGHLGDDLIMPSYLKANAKGSSFLIFIFSPRFTSPQTEMAIAI